MSNMLKRNTKNAYRAMVLHGIALYSRDYWLIVLVSLYRCSFASFHLTIAYYHTCLKIKAESMKDLNITYLNKFLHNSLS